MVELTADQRDLMRRVAHKLGPCLASPDAEIDCLRTSHVSGGGAGFGYRFGSTAITGEWHEWIPVRWAGPNSYRPEGEPIQWRAGALLRHTSISYERLHRWCLSLPADLRARALTHWRMPTRDLDALDRLTLAAIDADDPQPALFDLA
ncbi:hypothetical protein [Nocardia brasiliensis]|uniref:hypothetical protein n=1 Tax=Nocardia brasiliensis TaxID=37326 RepID=UPI0004A741F8|nr:hypothetical protein [Nocardia brasiliensis]